MSGTSGGPRAPKITMRQLREDYAEFVLSDTDVSMANALRRIMVAEVGVSSPAAGCVQGRTDLCLVLLCDLCSEFTHHTPLAAAASTDTILHACCPPMPTTHTIHTHAGAHDRDRPGGL
jgi:hypothetical protein